MPVIAGVGHETDFTIADFAADLRAATPRRGRRMAATPRADWIGSLLDAHAGAFNPRLQSGNWPTPRKPLTGYRTGWSARSPISRTNA